MKIIEVVAAIIFYNDEILCTQRPKSKYEYISEKFEFPGGKIEYEETLEQALQREILEELNSKLKINSFFLTVNHEYPDFKLIMHSFLCEIENKNISLNAHIHYEWLKIEELKKLDWAAADIPIVDKLITNG